MRIGIEIPTPAAPQPEDRCEGNEGMNAVSCSVSRWLLEIAAEAEISLERLSRRIPVDLEQLTEPDRYIDWDVFVTLCESLVDLSPNFEILADRIGNNLARRFERDGAELDLPIRDERQLYWIAQRWVAPKLFPGLDFELTVLGPTDLRLTAEIPSGIRQCEPFFALLARGLALLPRFIDREEAALDFEADGRSATFHISIGNPVPETATNEPAPAIREDTDAISGEASVVGLDAIVSNVDRQLRRRIGEIELVTSLNSAVERVRADPRLIQQLILDLALSARCSMPLENRLSITTETIEIPPNRGEIPGDNAGGRHVLLEVRGADRRGGGGSFAGFKLYFPVVDALELEIAPTAGPAPSGQPTA